MKYSVKNPLQWAVNIFISISVFCEGGGGGGVRARCMYYHQAGMWYIALTVSSQNFTFLVWQSNLIVKHDLVTILNYSYYLVHLFIRWNFENFLNCQTGWYKRDQMSPWTRDYWVCAQIRVHSWLELGVASHLLIKVFSVMHSCSNYH